MIATICDRMKAAPEGYIPLRDLTRSSGTIREGLGMNPTLKQDDPCSVQGCTSTQGPKGARGLCFRHYQRMRSTGSPTGTLRPTAEARFLAKVVKVPSGCWLWNATLQRNGYGRFHCPTGATAYAHIWAYEHYVGPVPVGLELDHLCRKRSCVNPNHLEPVTHRENLLRGDTLPARNAAKTHCPRGHEFTFENTYTPLDGKRYCRACQRIQKTNSKNRKAA